MEGDNTDADVSQGDSNHVHNAGMEGNIGNYKAGNSRAGKRNMYLMDAPGQAQPYDWSAYPHVMDFNAHPWQYREEQPKHEDPSGLSFYAHLFGGPDDLGGQGALPYGHQQPLPLSSLDVPPDPCHRSIKQELTDKPESMALCTVKQEPLEVAELMPLHTVKQEPLDTSDSIPVTGHDYHQLSLMAIKMEPCDDQPWESPPPSHNALSGTLPVKAEEPYMCGGGATSVLAYANAQGQVMPAGGHFGPQFAFPVGRANPVDPFFDPTVKEEPVDEHSFAAPLPPRDDPLATFAAHGGNVREPNEQEGQQDERQEEGQEDIDEDGESDDEDDVVKRRREKKEKKEKRQRTRAMLLALVEGDYRQIVSFLPMSEQVRLNGVKAYHEGRLSRTSKMRHIHAARVSLIRRNAQLGAMETSCQRTIKVVKGAAARTPEGSQKRQAIVDAIMREKLLETS